MCQAVWQTTRHYYETSLSVLANIYTNSLAELGKFTKETVEHLILFCLTYLLICVLLYVAAGRWKLLEFQRDIGATSGPPDRVMIVIAHPDDECMFFGPTVLNFTRKPNCKVYIMCLSTGQNYGMGKTRKRELYKSCEVLGIDKENILVHNHTDLPDERGIKWPIDVVSHLVLQQVEAFNINILVTFDRHGVSHHTNHTSIYYAVANLSIEKKLPKNCSVYVLESVNLLRKYWLFLDLPVSYVLSRIRFLVKCADRSLIHGAMRQHQSQLVWFRRLYMYFSRYMLVNTLQKMDISDIELDLDLDD